MAASVLEETQKTGREFAEEVSVSRKTLERGQICGKTTRFMNPGNLCTDIGIGLSGLANYRTDSALLTKQS